MTIWSSGVLGCAIQHDSICSQLCKCFARRSCARGNGDRMSLNKHRRFQAGWGGMRIRAGALPIALCAVISIGLLGGCESRSYPRVRMTATVESNGVRYSGSSVQEYLCTPSTHLMNDLDKCSVRGEAVVVDIKGKGLLFLIFDMPGARSITEMPRSVLGAASSDPLHATNAALPKH